MSTANSAASPFALYPAQLLGAKSGVIINPPPDPGVPAVGAPLSLFLPTVNQNTKNTEGAARLMIDPIPNGPDTVAVRLFVNGIEDAVKNILPGEENDIIYFDLFMNSLYDGVNPIHYVAEDAAGHCAESRPLWVVYSSTLPGGNDVPGSGDHPYLILTLPSPGDWFDKDDFPFYLVVSYPNTKPYDVITLILNGKPFEFTVQPGEETGDYVIEVTALMIAQAGNRPDFSFVFTVRDQLGNFTHQRRRSAPRLANVDINRTTVPAPDLIEKVGDPSDEADLVHLEKLESFLHFLIPIFTPVYQVGDRVVSNYTCMPVSGPAVTFSSEADVSRIPSTLDLPVPAAKVLVTGLISAKYKVIRNGQVFAVSRTTQATVVSPDFIDPAIKAIIDEDNYPVPKNGSTVYPDIRVDGYCTANLSVEIFDGATSYGTVKGDAKGYWFRDISGLAVGLHNIRVVAVYDPSRSVSHPFSVRVLAPPVITQVTRANGTHVPPGGSAASLEWLTFSGTCGSLPYNRSVRLGTHPGHGGYGINISPNVTTWIQQIAYLGPGHFHHALYDRWLGITEKGPISNYWAIVWG